MAVRRTQVGQRLTSFCWTLNNYTADQYQSIQSWCMNNSTWSIIGKEVGESGTPHLQGFTLLKKQASFNICHQALFNAHIEPKSRKSTYQDQYNYCSKDGEFWQCGEQPADKQGKRQDLLEAAKLIQQKKSMKDLAEEYPDIFIKFHKGLIAYRAIIQPERSVEHPPKIYWYYGPTGTGKTRTAYERGISEYGADGCYICPSQDLKWFDGYTGQPLIIIDDFRAKGVSFNFLLRLLDRFPMQLPNKGGYFPLRAVEIIITTPLDIESTFETRFKHKPEDITQMLRRVTEVKYFPSTTTTTITINNNNNNNNNINMGSISVGSRVVSGTVRPVLVRQNAGLPQCVVCCEVVEEVNAKKQCKNCKS